MWPRADTLGMKPKALEHPHRKQRREASSAAGILDRQEEFCPVARSFKEEKIHRWQGIENRNDNDKHRQRE